MRSSYSPVTACSENDGDGFATEDGSCYAVDYDDGINNDSDNKVDYADKMDCGKSPVCAGGSGGAGGDSELRNDGDGKMRLI